MTDKRSDDADDLDMWLTRLSNPSLQDDQELDALRRAIDKHHERAEQTVDELQKAGELLSDEHALQQLRFRLRQEGLAPRARKWRIWAPTAIAALLVVALVLPLLMPGEDYSHIPVLENAPPVFRNAHDVIEVKVRQPFKAAREFAEVAGEGARPIIYQHEGLVTLDFEAKPSDLERLNPEIGRFAPGMRLTPGLNRIVFKDASGK